MNCEDYKEALAADPSYEGGEAHLSACADCRAFRDGIRSLDRRIGRALEITVPELRMPELPDIDTAEVVSLPTRRRIKSPAWLAVAATIVLAAFVGLRMVGSNVTYASLADEIVVMKPRSGRVAEIVPVDSEQAAIFQCLQAGRREEVRRLVLTASGGTASDTLGDLVSSDTFVYNLVANLVGNIQCVSKKNGLKI